MRRRCLIFAACLLIIGRITANPVRQTIVSGGYTREYLVYTPQHPQMGQPSGVLITLHGFNGSMDNFFNAYDFREIADSLNYIILAPQALPEQNEAVRRKADILNLLMGDKLKLDAVWGCGLKVKAVLGFIPLLDDELNSDVDDVKFISQMIQQTLTEYVLPPDNVFMIGTSMGGYMTYQYALLQPVKLSGMVSVAGSMGLAIKEAGGDIQMPVCDFHSVTDEVVPYTGLFTQSGATVYLAQNKADVIRYWTTVNETGAPVTENINYYPSTNAITVEKITYPAPVNEVIHYRIDGAYHNHFFKKEQGDCMDYREEIAAFIVAHSSSSPTGNNQPQSLDITVYPNPAQDVIYFGVETGNIRIYNLTGQTVWAGVFHSGSLDISFLKSGMYIIHIQEDGKMQAVKMNKR